MSFPRYPKYKPSGVEWLGEVPEHWATRRLGFLVDQRREKVSDLDFPALSVTKNGVVPQLETAAKTDDGDNRKLVRQGDFVINSRSDRRGSAGVSPLDGSVSLINTVLRLRDPLNRAFTHHLLRSVGFQEEFYRYGKGIVADLWSTNFSEMKDILAPVPPITEQRAIAAFLDQETAKIDALIAEQEKLIELLAEKRQAVISHAVTKGLNPAAPMKPSGVEWLGDVPAHWQVLPLHRLVDRTRPITYGIVQPGQADPSGRYMIRGQDYSSGWAAPDQLFRVSPSVEEPYRRARVKPGDLVMTIVGAGVGNVAIVPSWLDGANLTQTTARIAVDTTKANLSFLSAALQSDVGLGSVGHYAKGAAQPGLNIEHVRVFPIPVPPLDEQRAIATALLRLSNDGMGLHEAGSAAIQLLRERRSALISAAVTGQIDVRNAVPETAA